MVGKKQVKRRTFMGNKLSKAEEYREKAAQMDPHDNFKEVSENLRKAMHIYQELGEHVLYIRAINFLGLSFAAIGRYPEALDCYLEGLDYAKAYRIKGFTHVFYNNIGTRYQELGDWDKALSYFLLAKEDMQSCDLSDWKNRSAWMVVTELNLGLVYIYIGDYERAEVSLSKAYRLNEEGEISMYDFSLAIIKAKLRYAQGNISYVKEHIPKLLDQVGDDEAIIGDHFEDVREFVELLKMCEDTDNWKILLEKFDQYTEKKGVLIFRIKAKEFWCEYYRYIHDDELFKLSCVQYAELMEAQDAQSNEERSSALKLMVELDEAEMLYESEKKNSEKDVLTGLGNRFAMKEDFETIIRGKENLETVIAVGLLDLDCLKELNDSYGHLAGDEALRIVSGLIFNSVDGFGRAYRFGGDEFLIMIPNASKMVMERMAQKIKTKLKEALIKNERADTGYLTISQAYIVIKITAHMEVEQVLKKVDDRLYDIKNSGKNNYTVDVLDSKDCLSV